MKKKILEQKQARALRSKGQSLNQIVEKLGIAKSSASMWTRSIVLTKEQKKSLREREALGAAKGRHQNSLLWKRYRLIHPKPEPDARRLQNLNAIQEFFANWSNNMAYALGFFAADGCMYHSANGGHSTGGYYTVFQSSDLELVKIIQEMMSIRNKIEMHIPKGPRKPKYYIRIVNHKLFNRLSELGMTPSKSLTLRLPPVPKEFLSHFTRGYFDGDGHIYIGNLHRKDRKCISRIIQSGFTSGSYKFLETLQLRLHEEGGIGMGSLHPHGENNWELSYSKEDTLLLGSFMYGNSTVPCLQRKKIIFDQALCGNSK